MGKKKSGVTKNKCRIVDFLSQHEVLWALYMQMQEEYSARHAS